jgi:hypothetical protein
MKAGALEDSRGYKTRGFGIFDFSREGGDFGKFSPIFPLRGYYINPVNSEGLKSRNFYSAFDLLKTAIYRIANRKAIAESRKKRCKAPVSILSRGA